MLYFGKFENKNKKFENKIIIFFENKLGVEGRELKSTQRMLPRDYHLQLLTIFF
jgi:hypothetical protein